MLHLGSSNAWDGYDETPDEIASGGLLPSTYNEQSSDSGSDEDDEAEPMDEGSDDEETTRRRAMADLNVNTAALVFPPQIVSRFLIYEGDGGWVCVWPVAAVPAGLGSLAPQTLKALPATDPELLQRQCTACFMQALLPGIVHVSPLVALLGTAAACRAAAKDGLPMQSVVAPREPKWTSWFQSALQLQQLKTSTLEGLLPFHESVTPVALRRHSLEYWHQLKLAESDHNARLDVLYARNASLPEHVAAWEAQALQYVHLLEYFLWSCLVAPYPGAPALEDVLTPTEPSPPLNACHADLAPVLLEDVRKFFADKRQRLLEARAEDPATYARHHDLPDPACIVPRLQAAQEPTYNGWIPIAYLEDYARHLQDPEGQNK